MAGLPKIQKKPSNLGWRKNLVPRFALNIANNVSISLGAVGPTSDPGVAADFPWEEITKGKDGIVDVGGGQGTLCCSLALKYLFLKRLLGRS